MNNVQISEEGAKRGKGFQKGNRHTPVRTPEQAQKAAEARRFNKHTLAVQEKANSIMAERMVETLGDKMVKATEAAITMCAEFVTNTSKPDETRLRAAGILTQQGWAAAPKKTLALNVNASVINDRFSNDDLQLLAKRFLDGQSGGSLRPTSAANQQTGSVVEGEVVTFPQNDPQNND